LAYGDGHADRVSGALGRKLSRDVHAFVLPAFAGDLRAHGDSHSARARKSGCAAQSVLDSVWASALLFDLGGAIAAVSMAAMAIGVAVRHTAELYRQEPLKQEPKP